MSHKAYPEYKDSGDEWLGEVPEHWSILTFQRCIHVAEGQVDPEEEPYASMTLIAPNHVESSSGRILALETAMEQGAESGKYLCQPSDVIYSKIRPALRKACLSPGDCLCSADMYPLRPSCCLIREFLFWFILSEQFSSQSVLESERVAMPKINRESLKAVRIGVPSLSEQESIAAFLDRETAKIDALVAEQEKLIELLKEKRQAVISHAVTNGLDQNAPMKDSGVEWLGEVPEHWEVGAIKHFFEFLDGKRIPLSGEERSSRSGEYPYYGASGIIDWIDDFIFDEDLVLVSEDGANLACRSTPISFIARGKYWVNNHAHILRPIDEALVYWAERVEAIDLTPVISGSAQPKLTSESLANIKISVPPTYEERHAIQCFISQEVGGIDDLLAEAQRAIDLLKERRVALISAAVTGKIDVRGLAGAV